MNFSEIGIAALQVVSPLLITALTWATAKAASYIKSKVNNEYLHGVLVRLEEAVVTVVKDMQQTLVDEIKAANADGKITDAEKQHIKDTALANVKIYLGPKGMKVLSDVLGLSGGALNGFLSSKIESAVHDIRATDRSVMNAIPRQAGAPAPLP